MIIGKIFQDGKLIDEGICGGGKHFNKDYPEQYICIYEDTDKLGEEKRYNHDTKNGIYFVEYQDNGNGWETVYDSREGVDRTVEYPLPSWMTGGSRIPKHRHRYNNGTIETEFMGYYQ